MEKMDDPAEVTAEVPTKKKKKKKKKREFNMGPICTAARRRDVMTAPFVATRPGHFAYRNFEWPHLLGQRIEAFCLLEYVLMAPFARPRSDIWPHLHGRGTGSFTPGCIHSWPHLLGRQMT